MSSPIYYEGESAYLTNSHLQVLLNHEKSNETPESLRKNPGRLEELYNRRKLHTSLDVQVVNDILLHWQVEGTPQRKSLPVDDNENNVLEQSPSPPNDFPYVRHPYYFYYFELIRDGGRPAMPFGLFMQIWDAPEPEWQGSVSTWKDVLRCREFLPFLDRGDSLFGWQWRRWRVFRDWQYVNRNVIHGDFEGELCTEAWDRFYGFKLQENARMRMKQGMNSSAFEICEEDAGISEAIDAFRGKILTSPLTACANTYVEAVHRRLRRRGYDAKVQLRVNPKHQDNLATWLEYVAFEIWNSDVYQKNSKTELHKVSFEFLATWALSQVPLVEEQTRTARDQGEAWTGFSPVDEESFGFATKWQVHHQDSTIAVRDFAIPACRVPKDVALEHVLGIPAPTPTVEAEPPEPSHGEKRKPIKVLEKEDAPVPKIVVFEASSRASTQEQDRDTALLAPPYRLRRRRLQRKISEDIQPDARYSKKRVLEGEQASYAQRQSVPCQPATAGDVPMRTAGMLEAHSSAGKEEATFDGPSMIDHSSPTNDREQYVKDVMRGLRRSSRIAALKAAKRSSPKHQQNKS